MEVYPTKDITVIKGIFGLPYIYSACRDDSCPEDPSGFDFRAAMNSWIFLEVRRYPNSLPVGVFMFTPVDEHTVEAHTLMTKFCRGSDAIDAGRKATKWIFENTKATKIVSYSFSDSPQVYWFARKLGLTKTSEEPWEATRNGKKVTVNRLAIEKQ